MWIALNNSFLSIVENLNNPGELLVRARLKGDIENVFPEALTFEDQSADYRYRAFLERQLVAEVIADKILSINYGNFKSSIDKSEHLRHDVYLKVWSNLRVLQD